MYIPPFWCGVVCTIIVEIGAVLTAAILIRHNQDDE